ncbi:helix-turn-helix domain-containing protein [Caulobacter endophyticus]|uniref:helix-turn-helix domain-containing protein n=1 Tax=Caulobacter endophyticus TaxID=2172652 RepID=UPI00240FFFEB|nr:helix-turn-helix transcriptional regulator [Caulobacter endophyticus]MDG2531023.1 helix-turn-helix transcriptional regulator [Caulobacter endophyticus]
MTNAFASYIASQLVLQDRTADQLAEAAGYKRSTIIGMWVRGEFIPDQSLLPKLAEVLGVDIVTLALNWLAAALPNQEEAFLSAIVTRAQQIELGEDGQ